MNLPDDDSIDLPDDDDWFVVFDGELPAPVWDPDAMLQLVPEWARTPGLTVRDALLKAWGLMANRMVAGGVRLFQAQQSPRYAEGRWLDWWGDRLHRPRAPGEADADYRARLLAHPDRITKPAIRKAVDSIVGDRFAPRRAVFVEPKRDFAFWRSVSASASSSHSYWQSRASGHGRHWASGTRTGLRTAGAYWVSALLGARFWVIVPATLTTKRGGWASVANARTHKAFWSQSGPPRTSHTVWTSATTQALFSTLVREIGTRAAGGVAWQVVADAHLENSITR